MTGGLVSGRGARFQEGFWIELASSARREQGLLVSVDEGTRILTDTTRMRRDDGPVREVQSN